MTIKNIAKKKKTSIGKMAMNAGAAAVSAGAYYFLGPEGKQHRKEATAWIKEAKKETKSIKKVWKKKTKTKTKPKLH